MYAISEHCCSCLPCVSTPTPPAIFSFASSTSSFSCWHHSCLTPPLHLTRPPLPLVSQAVEFSSGWCFSSPTSYLLWFFRLPRAAFLCQIPFQWLQIVNLMFHFHPARLIPVPVLIQYQKYVRRKVCLVSMSNPCFVKKLFSELFYECLPWFRCLCPLFVLCL